ncbi:ubiquinone/menaquinone biosynthesis C-methylase UbiE [Dyadobacter jejuensis]|uniref:Ubiquinone/menaquinone biosynthesis C-methylase UbiE n=1 Tax=Dyadobacter jejuensis TaxID=1082580 RepID=A0A316ASP1_9BACT|nr:class I SAM-dependent methyltransferase [Dyadobacter jejuensis]PWJ60356.1 ubiquinone/menaquinone biosynthesis C-methylase UbiE [Dyadobacter jejuensis]
MENSKMTVEKLSHEAHSGWYKVQYATKEAQEKAIADWRYDQDNRTINHWIHKRLLELVNPLLIEPKSWLTVGDGYGFDANFFYTKGLDVTATDISDTFLPLSQQEGLFEKYAVENAEKLSFEDNTYDYIFCKEAYHHFPRPYMAVYEMLRVAKEGVILVEPHDPISKMPFLLALRNIFDRFDTSLLQKYWKNRYSFEAVGNYVFKLSEREMDKLANGIGMPMVAFKGINNNYYNAAAAHEKADDSSAAFRKIKRKLRIHNLLSKFSLMPTQVLCAVIFKKRPSDRVMAALEKDGFQIHIFPPNPYAKKGP